MSTENNPNLFPNAEVSYDDGATQADLLQEVTPVNPTNAVNPIINTPAVNNHPSINNPPMNNEVVLNPVIKTAETNIASNVNNVQDNNVKQVNIVIAGFSYTINCPVSERDELNKAVGYINGFIRELRKTAPALSHENLLILCCLNLYEEMQQQRSNTASLMQTDQQVRSLLEKISSDANSILN